jgi:hypothetical protein
MDSLTGRQVSALISPAQTIEPSPKNMPLNSPHTSAIDSQKRNPPKISPPGPKKKRKENDADKGDELGAGYGLQGMITSPHAAMMAQSPQAMPGSHQMPQKAPQNYLGTAPGQLYMQNQPGNYQSILQAMNSLPGDAYANPAAAQRFPQPQKPVAPQEQAAFPAAFGQSQPGQVNLEQAIKMMNVMAASAEFNMLSQQQQQQILSSMASLQKPVCLFHTPSDLCAGRPA